MRTGTWLCIGALAACGAGSASTIAPAGHRGPRPTAARAPMRGALAEPNDERPRRVLAVRRRGRRDSQPPPPTRPATPRRRDVPWRWWGLSVDAPRVKGNAVGYGATPVCLTVPSMQTWARPGQPHRVGMGELGRSRGAARSSRIRSQLQRLSEPGVHSAAVPLASCSSTAATRPTTTPSRTTTW